VFEPEIIVPFSQPRDKLPLASRVRSTLIASSVRSVREHGFYDAYLDKLDPAWRATILDAVAGVWLPIDAGIAHYRACDALGLSAGEQMEIGREVGDRIQKTFLASMVRAARGIGVTPWNAFQFGTRLYERQFEGGGVCVVKLGPKEARCEVVCNPAAVTGHFRNGFRGLTQAGVELFSTKAYVVELSKLGTDTSFVLRGSWA
jgi:hypothetical protein